MGIEYRPPGGGYGWSTPPPPPDLVPKRKMWLWCLSVGIVIGLLALAFGYRTLAILIAAPIIIASVVGLRRERWAIRAMSQSIWSRVHKVGTRGYGSIPYEVSSHVLQRADSTYWVFTYDEAEKSRGRGPIKNLSSLNEARSAADKLAHEGQPLTVCRVFGADCGEWQSRAPIQGQN